ncbi:hypothetical protein [Streptomyces torulosus]|uniref:hypothetical protein n=1 Tax=Streptomyces torulosus TaxID=68276 RepID=UPI0006EB8A00|nr:hypothetical protein [Streptomyces torulosus]
MNTNEPTASADGTTAGITSLDLNAAFARIPDLDDETLRELVHGLDTDLKDCRSGHLDESDLDLIAVAAAARITLRRRKAAAARSRAIHRVSQLINNDTPGGTA